MSSLVQGDRAGPGRDVADACRRIGVAEQSEATTAGATNAAAMLRV